ncbi:MAG: hypothetical protein H7Y37_06145 [Anaerolineae bacterium]|nr:hypothetical protein [Gloeobacterales cyanobacterium ES-bin-313]
MRFSAYSGLTISLVCLVAGAAQAQSVDEVAVKATLTHLDETASRCDVDGMLTRYSPNFKSKDGLNVEATRKAFTSLCAKIDKPMYRSEVRSVKKLPKGVLQVVTTTNMTATYRTELPKPAQLVSTVESLNRFESVKGVLKLVGQEILAENTTISIGEKPPRVNLNLPTMVKPGRDFKIEAILPTPLQDSPALGGISLTPINAKTSTTLQMPTLEALRSGGIFKTGQAPSRQEDQSLTLAFVQDGGMILVSQRLRVTSAEPPVNSSPSKSE